MDEPKIHIGKIVESAFNQSSYSNATFARMIGIRPQNLKRMFENEDWSVIKLIMAGKALNVDFGGLFSIDKPEIEIQKSKITLQIEIEDDKLDEVLKFVEDKRLYKILKK